MDVVNAHHVATVLTSVAAYGSQLQKVFHNYALIAEDTPDGFESAVTILDAAVFGSQQISTLVKDEAGGKQLFNDRGLAYAQLLGQQSAQTLMKIQHIIAEACLEGKDRKAKRNVNKKKACGITRPEIDLTSLKLDEMEFLKDVEATKWSRVFGDIEKCIVRLCELQLHTLLLHDVVTVGALSRDISSGKVDVQSIVTYHDRIHRTAEWVGIKAPKGRRANRRYISSSSGSDGDSYSSSESGSDDSIISSRREKKLRGLSVSGPPPPPPAPRFGSGLPHQVPLPPSAINLPTVPPKVPEMVIMKEGVYEVIRDGIKPPAYSINNKSGDGSAGDLALAVPEQAMPQPKCLSTPAEKASSAYPDEKADPKSKDEESTTEETMKPASLEGHLFQSPSSSLMFKVKSIFRSKQSLAAEMKRTLSDSQSQLVAYVIQRYDFGQVPHSAFHTLEATHMKTILSSLHSSEWYKTFIDLDTAEHITIGRILRPWLKDRFHERELVVLKVLERNRFDAWMALLRELLKNRPLGSPTNGRVLLAIVREKFVDGQPLSLHLRPCYGPPPPALPPPPNPNVAPIVPSIRPPPMPFTPHRRTIVSDLKVPPRPAGWLAPSMPGAVGGPPEPPPLPLFPPIQSYSTTGFSPPPPGRMIPVRTSDLIPITDSDAHIVLTTYNEYTISMSQPRDRTIPLSWNLINITQETSDKRLILERIERFIRYGGNVIETKLRMTDLQCAQLTRLMDHLRGCEPDYRFEWTWAEISPYNINGEISPAAIANATRMHLIAKRSLKTSYRALDVYNERMNPPPPPPVSRPRPPVTIPARSRKTKYAASSDESDSDSMTWTSSDDYGGDVMKMQRRSGLRQLRKSRRAKYCTRSDSDSEDDEEDYAIETKLHLKRGDDVVKVLLDRWTPEVLSKGKEKAVA